MPIRDRPAAGARAEARAVHHGHPRRFPRGSDYRQARSSRDDRLERSVGRVLQWDRFSVGSETFVSHRICSDLVCARTLTHKRSITTRRADVDYQFQWIMNLKCCAEIAGVDIPSMPIGPPAAHYDRTDQLTGRVVSPVDRHFLWRARAQSKHHARGTGPITGRRYRKRRRTCADHAMESYSMMLVLMSELLNASALRDELRDLPHKIRITRPPQKAAPVASRPRISSSGTFAFVSAP